MEIRDKGAIPLDNPNAVPGVDIDPQTGQAWAVFIDLGAHRFAVWNQARGWVVNRAEYGQNVHLTGWQLRVQDGVVKLFATTFKNESPDGRSHLVVLPLYTI